MNWDAIGAIAELIASVVVVITLIFLVVQLKHNSVMIKNATAQHASETMGNFLGQLIGNPDIYTLYITGLSDYDSLKAEEKGRFHMLCLQAFRDVDTQYQHYVTGGVEREHWESILRSLDVVFRTPGGRKSWDYQKRLVTDSFREEIDRHLIDDA